MADFQFTQSGAQIQADLNLTENLQDAFSTSSTYAVGDLVIYNSKIYRCHTAVSSAGAWTGSTNWTEIYLDDILTSMTDADIDLAISAEVITTNITNGSASGDDVIAGTAEVKIEPDDGYALPSSVTVVGATSNYNSSTGVISLSNATGEVTITAECPSGGVITDLTGTTWELGDGFSPTNFGKPVQEIHGGFYSGTFDSTTGYLIDGNWNYYDPEFEPTFSWIGFVSGSGSAALKSWVDGGTGLANIPIAIYGGDDVTNPDLIDWLEANATQIT